MLLALVQAVTIHAAELPAAEPDQPIELLSFPFGLAPGQTLRYSWVHLKPHKRDIEPLRIEAKLFTADGRVIAQAEAPAVNAGNLQSFDFGRDQIDLPGEPRTGRLQVRLGVNVIRKGTWIADVSYEHTAEVIDTLTGRTTVSFKPKEIVVVGSKIGRQDEGDLSPAAALGGQEATWLDLGGPLGIAPRQTFRITVFLPRLSVPRLPPAEDGRKYKMLVAPLILDADGRVIARRAAITLEPGQFHSFDFERAFLPPGEPGTDRLQVRAEIQRRFFPGIAARISQGKAPASLELIDEGSGKTVLLVPAVQAAREARRPRR